MKLDCQAQQYEDCQSAHRTYSANTNFVLHIEGSGSAVLGFRD